MAQVCGGTTFDFSARRRHDAAQRMVCRAADLLATRGRDAVDLDALIAILLRIFLSRWAEYSSAAAEETHSLESWLRFVSTSPALKAESWVLQHPTVTDALPVMRTELSFAVEQWLLGNPEQPPTSHALNVIEHILFIHRLYSRPPAPGLPNTFLNASINVPND